MLKQLLFILFISLFNLAAAQTTAFSFQVAPNACFPIDVQFTQTSSGSPVGYLWDFGNGVKSNEANPLISFTSAGAYAVKLITVYENSTAQNTRTITIQAPVSANFTYDRGYMCQPGVVNFASTGNAINHTWDFGDSTALVSLAENTVAHTYPGYGDFTVTQTAFSSTGCSVTFSRIVRVVRPPFTGSITSELSGCIPATTTFTTTTDLPPGSTVSNYSWNFGDNTTITTTSGHASHVYNQTGAFAPTVTITTNEGCLNTFRFDSVAFGRPPVGHTAHPYDTVYCGSETAQFAAVATNANRYDWDFGGGQVTSVSDTFVEHKYSNLGLKDISVKPYFNGCAGTPVDFSIRIIGVIARFNFSNTCADKKTFIFNNSSQGHISTREWSLGDQASASNVSTVTHTYPQSGTFVARLLITDDITGCLDTFKTKIYTANPVLQNPAQSVCIHTSTSFSVLNNYSNPALTYTWNVLGLSIGPNEEITPVVTGDSLGHFNSQVVLNNGPQYCADTISLDHVITVRGPQLNFTAPENICLNSLLNVTNLSQPFQPADTVKLWSWNFGRVATNDTIYQPQPYQYSSARSYYVKLTAQDKFGCTDTLVKIVAVRPMPFLWIIPKTATLCEGQSSTLVGYTSDSILWTGANTAFCTTCDTTTVSPTATTKFYATAINSFNCAATDSSIVKVFSPFNAVALTPDTAFCDEEKLQLDVNPKNKVITWVPTSTLSNTNIYNPIATPHQTTNYTAQLTDSAGCYSSSATIKVTLKSKPIINAGADRNLSYFTNFTLEPTYGSNVASMIWSPGPGLSCNTCPNPTAIADKTQTYTLTATSDSGCVASDKVIISVECQGANIAMPAAFTPNNDKLNDLYCPLARGIKTINRFAIFNREGQLVYEMRNYVPAKDDHVGWNGKFRGADQHMATYIYFVEATCDMGQTIFSKGSFTLVR